ncbi:FUSC family protein [Pseudonocardia phyllosphaerae]|uniref:FUSC family protein n=1 Tax=Pseudonocardia phyllosphaerae TaxID=3390502 RepID=UPI00397B49A7
MPSALRSPVSRARSRLRLGARRLRGSWLPVLQCAFAAGLALYVAADLIGHQRPFFAPIAAVISLGMSLNSRLRRAAELVIGVSLGILVGDLIISQIGSGVWQLMLVVALALGIAVFTDGGSLFVNQAGSSAVLVTTLLPPGQSGGLDRCVDALVGGLAGILVAAIIPANPLRIARRETRRALDDLVTVLTEVAGALREHDVEAARRALRRARDTQKSIDQLRAAVGSAGEVATVSPFHRPRRRLLRGFRGLAERIDYAHRNARVLARRALTALEDGESVPPELSEVLTEIASAVNALISEISKDGDRERARSVLLETVHRAQVLTAPLTAPAPPSTGSWAAGGEDTRAAPPTAPTWEDPVPAVSVPVLVAQIRSIAVDLLQATGMTHSEALRALREQLPSPQALPDRGAVRARVTGEGADLG